LLKIIN